jgi:Arabinogalactan peptide
MQIAYGEKTSAPTREIDANEIDQGIAYVLMLITLLITYVIH